MSREAKERIPFASRRALPTETKVESGTSQTKSGTSVNLSNSGVQRRDAKAPACEFNDALNVRAGQREALFPE